jgi:hypothetical protein
MMMLSPQHLTRLTKRIKFIPSLTTPPPSPTRQPVHIRRQPVLWDEQTCPPETTKGIFFGEEVSFECTVRLAQICSIVLTA